MPPACLRCSPGAQRSSLRRRFPHRRLARVLDIVVLDASARPGATAISCPPVRCASRRRPWHGPVSSSSTVLARLRTRGVAADGGRSCPPGGLGGRPTSSWLRWRDSRTRPGGTSRRCPSSMLSAASPPRSFHRTLPVARDAHREGSLSRPPATTGEIAPGCTRGCGKRGRRGRDDRKTRCASPAGAARFALSGGGKLVMINSYERLWER